MPPLFGFPRDWEYEPRTRCMLGNFAQARSHMALINAVANLTKARGPAQDRKEG